MTIEEVQQEIIEEFSVYEDWMDKYSYLIELGNELEDLPPKEKNDQNLIKGCQSRVWLVAEKKDDKIEYDVCVYGGTSAGVIAAYKASNMGKKVLLIEPSKHLGGMTASGLGMTDIGDKNAICGVTLDFYKRIARHYGEDDKKLRFEPHVAENIFNEMVNEAGFDTILYHRVIEVNKEGKTIRSIVLENALYPGT